MGARLSLIFLLFSSVARSQQLQEGQRKGLLQTTASLYPAFMLNRAIQNNYVGGHLTYYFEDKYSYRGDIWAYIDAQTETKYISNHTQLNAGFGRHFPIKRFDPFIYINMGLASIRLQSQKENTLQPTLGTTIGLHYNVSRFFYFFGECVYTHMKDVSRVGNLDQLYVSGGLGFQIPTRKN